MKFSSPGKISRPRESPDTLSVLHKLAKISLAKVFDFGIIVAVFGEKSIKFYSDGALLTLWISCV